MYLKTILTLIGSCTVHLIMHVCVIVVAFSTMRVLISAHTGWVLVINQGRLLLITFNGGDEAGRIMQRGFLSFL